MLLNFSNRRSMDTRVYEVPNIVAVNTGASENNFDEVGPIYYGNFDYT